MAANLTQVAINTRKAIRWSIYFVVFFTIARILFGFGRSIYKATFPAPPPPPTVGFSRLGAIPFPAQVETIPQITFRVETPTGSFPSLPDALPVYLIPASTSTLNAPDVAREKATNLGYTTQPVLLTQTLYRFVHPQYPTTLEMNIVDGTFSTSFNLASDPTPLQEPPPTEQEATRVAFNQLSRIGSLEEDLDEGRRVIEYLKVDGQRLTQALSFSDADLTKVNIYRRNVILSEELEYPVVTADPNEANIWFIVSGSDTRGKEIIASEFLYYKVDYETVETYPLKTAQAAFDELVAGGGYIANLGNNKNGNVVLRRIYLAYYDPNQSTRFFQPVIVFEGDNDFAAYVPAVTSEYYGE